MKAIITHTLTVLLAILVLCGGSATGFVSHCRNSCRPEKTEAVANNSCCKSHGQRHVHDRIPTAEPPRCGCEKPCKTDCCTLERIDFEWNQTINPTFNFQPPATNLFALAALPVISVLSGSDVVETLRLCRSGPPRAVLPGTYLSLLTVLLI